MMESSIIALPAVFAVISRPSRIGTPEEMSVASVRQNLATATFFSSSPRIGSLSMMRSITRRPPWVA